MEETQNQEEETEKEVINKNKTQIYENSTTKIRRFQQRKVS